MNTVFIDILQKLTAEQGKEVLLNASKCKAFLADYTHGEYKKESRLLLQAIEAGVSKAIDTTEELEICKKQQTRELVEEHFLAQEAAADVVETFALVLRGKQEIRTQQNTVCKNCGKELQKDWKTCPYCETSINVRQKQAPAPTPSNSSVTRTFSTQSYSPESDFEVKREGNGINITKYIGSNSVVNIPPKIQNLPVTSIGDWAFQSCTNLTSVTIPNSVISIGYRAFYECRNLTSLNIPDSVVNIGEYAFSFCNSLKSITVPKNVIYIEESAFAECASLTSVTIGNSVKSIGDRAFLCCDSLTSVTFESVLHWKAFSNCSFSGDLRDKYLTEGKGTYTRESGGTTWTKKS